METGLAIGNVFSAGLRLPVGKDYFGSQFRVGGFFLWCLFYLSINSRTFPKELYSEKIYFGEMEHNSRICLIIFTGHYF